MRFSYLYEGYEDYLSGYEKYELSATESRATESHRTGTMQAEFAIPNAEEESIIEYSYTLHSVTLKDDVSNIASVCSLVNLLPSILFELYEKLTCE